MSLFTNLEKKNVLQRYNLPLEVKYCKLCTISNQRPRITFDENGVCSACNYAVYKRERVDWSERERELVDLCNRHRKSNGKFDIIVPCSGGKDGSYVAHQLKHRYGMNPLCVTWAPLLPTEIGRRNLDAFIRSGFNHIMGTPNPKTTKRLTQLAFAHLGDPFQPFIYGQTNFPMHIAEKYDVQLIMYGENGEVEYGGDMKNAFKPTRDIADHDSHYFSGLPPEFWTEHGVTIADLYPFQAPEYARLMENKTEIHFYGHYKFWDPQENFYYCVEHTDFQPNTERSEGTYSKYASLDDRIDGYHYYLGYIKFGIGRTTSDTAHEIRDHKIDRNEGIALVRRYDGEFPRKYLQEFLDYCEITEDDFQMVIDSWRSDHIWKKEGAQWKLRTPIWEST
ncbi:MAG: N-acetyl sugar amidotransferase [Betaproteobacteria bacterium]|nr:N-acetyl sugar amidotransferase [Betaproteobacteria bacterium]